MTCMSVKFERPNQVVDFVNTISRYEYDADIKYGSCVVDAKSIMGVMSLAAARTVELVLHAEKNENPDIFNELARFTA
ncbi:HPr family phosphocarrier protein [Clostridium sp. MCC353]|uniref:HPr family phosphocarrier protein n=1 Tax=Clostridium sp. MCC353 TaxID=2592646 RepID=UPI001C028A88|nr:HPr family phosphocarrier protein [Clostridium sp. MCC353]MBT9777164.1 HPr family phosphocarrier protein [Clostridium sp. MCC353]